MYTTQDILNWFQSFSNKVIIRFVGYIECISASLYTDSDLNECKQQNEGRSFFRTKPNKNWYPTNCAFHTRQI